MSWLRIDDGLIDHPKLLEAGDLLGENGVALACGLYVEGLTYASRKLTDGKIFGSVLKTFHSVSDPISVANALVSVGLWDKTDDKNYAIHDYLEFNDSAKAVKKRRLTERDRKRSVRRVSAPDTGRTNDGHLAPIVRLARARSPTPTPIVKSTQKIRSTTEGETDDGCERAGAFCQLYRWTLYPDVQGVAYTPQQRVEISDLDAAERLTRSYTDEQLEEMARFFLAIPDDRDKFLKNKKRTVTMLLSYAEPIAKNLWGQRDRK